MAPDLALMFEDAPARYGAREWSAAVPLWCSIATNLYEYRGEKVDLDKCEAAFRPSASRRLLPHPNGASSRSNAFTAWNRDV